MVKKHSKSACLLGSDAILDGEGLMARLGNSCLPVWTGLHHMDACAMQ